MPTRYVLTGCTNEGLAVLEYQSSWSGHRWECESKHEVSWQEASRRLDIPVGVPPLDGTMRHGLREGRDCQGASSLDGAETGGCSTVATDLACPACAVRLAVAERDAGAAVLHQTHEALDRFGRSAGTANPAPEPTEGE